MDLKLDVRLAVCEVVALVPDLPLALSGWREEEDVAADGIEYGWVEVEADREVVKFSSESRSSGTSDKLHLTTRD